MRIKIDPLDKVFSEYIRKRAVFNTLGCEFCGSQRAWDRLQCSHFHGRRSRMTRYDPENACGLCFTCHIFLGEHPNIHSEFFKKRLGSDGFEQLNIRANQICKMTEEMKDRIGASLKAQIKEMDKGD